MSTQLRLLMLAVGNPYEREGRREWKRERESIREGGMGNTERERGGKTAACSHPTFYSSVNPIV